MIILVADYEKNVPRSLVWIMTLCCLQCFGTDGCVTRRTFGNG